MVYLALILRISYNRYMQRPTKNCTFLSQNEVETIELYLPKREDIKKMEQIFSALSVDTRLKIVCALSIKRACVTDLITLLNINQTTLSHQLAYLKSVGIVDCKREGRTVVYYICAPSVYKILSASVDFIEDGKSEDYDICLD